MLSVKISLPESGEKEFFQEQEDGGLLGVSAFRRATGFLENQAITIELNNIHGYWYSVWNSPDKYLIGQAVQVFDDGLRIGTFKISKIIEISDVFKIKADSFTNLSKTVTKRLCKSDFPDIDVNDGKVGNIIGGTLDGDGGVCVAYRVEANKYHAAFHPLTITNVYDKDGNSITFTVTNDVDCYILTTNLDEKEIFFNAQGFDTNPGIVLKKINETFGGYSIVGLDEAIEKYEERFYSASILISTLMSFREFLLKFEAEFDTTFFLDSYGQINIRVQDQEDVSPPEEISYESIGEFIVEPEITIIDRITRKYGYHYRNDDYSFQITSVMESNWQSTEAVREFRYNNSATGTFDVVSRSLYRHSQPIECIKFSLPFMLSVDIFSVISIKLPAISIHPLETRIYLVTAFQHTKKETYIEALDLYSRKGQIVLLDQEDPKVAILYDENDIECLSLM